jgi:hypothetical protein
VLIFADGFEAGNVLAWTSAVTDSGRLSVTSAAALVGTRGLQVAITNNNSKYVVDDRPVAEVKYRARFYFDPNSITMASGNAHYLFYGLDASSNVVVRIELQRSGSLYQLRASARNNASTWSTTAWATISDVPHLVQLDWQAATTAGANNGLVTLTLDGAPQGSITNVANDTRRIERAQLGAVAGIDTGTRGTEFFDAFESYRLP